MSHTPLTATIDGDAPPRDRIYVEHRDGRPVHYSDVLKRDVERLAIRTVRDRSKTAQASLRSTESQSKYYAVYLEASDDRSFCLAPCLSIEELDWLRRTIEFWVRRGSDL